MNNRRDRGDRLARLAQLQALELELKEDARASRAAESERQWREQCHKQRLAVAEVIIKRGNSYER